MADSAPAHFNHNLMSTDIYDFVTWAKTFDLAPDTVRLVNVWAIGKDYEALYRRPHKDYPDGWKYGDDEQLGVLYLKEDEIHSTINDRIYRYWKCFTTTPTDERHTHITFMDR